MCTVTIIPLKYNNFVLTSNRDEGPNRVSTAPNIYTINNTKLLFPKDEQSGGTWIGVSEKKRLVCVLNGGFLYHERKQKYRMSRGIVAKDLLASSDLNATIDDYNFQDIEPFTMVILEWNRVLNIMELVWDGKNKYFITLPIEPKIWSSSTLYSKSMTQERQEWFETYKDTNELNAKTAMDFHENAGHGNTDYGVIMDRVFVKTTSITQVEKSDDFIEMRYSNLNTNESNSKVFETFKILNE